MEIWTEKYRPGNLNDVVGQKDVVSRLKSFVEKNSMQHCLFAGPAGTGKTTCAIALARELFGENWQNNFLETNASQERGIQVVREKIKDFARTKPLGTEFKIILLDEADSLTKDAQHALRRTMENYASSCRFILSCNYSSKLIDPIQSRCAIFRFSNLNENNVTSYLKKISESENFKISENTLKAVFETSNGDLRRAVNILQSISSIKDVDESKVYEMTSQAPPELINNIINFGLKGDIKESRKFLFDLLLRYGLSGSDFLKQMLKEVWKLKIDDKKRLKIIEKIGECEFRIVEGSDEQIQLEALLAQLSIL